MTREDIDNIINIICPNDEDFEKPIISPAYLKKELETLALEQEPSGDLISREAVQDYIAKYLSQYLYNDVREAVEAIDEYIGELPPVKQEPKTGHWSHDGSHWKNRFICSECGYKLFDEPTNYCPNCGAKMVEPQESEDKG